MQTAASFLRVQWRRGGVWGEGTCATVRYDMLSFCHHADIYFRVAKLPSAAAVGWLYESHLHWRDMHFGHALVFQGEWANYARAGLAYFNVFFLLQY